MQTSRDRAVVLCPPVRMSPKQPISTTSNKFEDWCAEHGEYGEKLLAEYVDPEKGPRDVTYASHHKALWMCSKCGHPWKAQIDKRTKEKAPSGCPACAGRVATDTNNLRLTCEQSEGQLYHLIGEWDHPTEPMEAFLPRSGVKVPWKCGECGHSWKATIATRTDSKAPRGCPECYRLSKFKPGNNT